MPARSLRKQLDALRQVLSDTLQHALSEFQFHCFNHDDGRRSIQERHRTGSVRLDPGACEGFFSNSDLIDKDSAFT